MDDTISRREAIDALSHCQTYLFDSRDDDKKISLEDAEYAIEQLPSAQQERKKGKWIYYPKASGSVKSTALHLYPVCSECGCEHPVANYCPNCGANMKGEQND